MASSSIARASPWRQDITPDALLESKKARSRLRSSMAHYIAQERTHPISGRPSSSALEADWDSTCICWIQRFREQHGSGAAQVGAADQAQRFAIRGTASASQLAHALVPPALTPQPSLSTSSVTTPRSEPFSDANLLLHSDPNIVNPSGMVPSFGSWEPFVSGLIASPTNAATALGHPEKRPDAPVQQPSSMALMQDWLRSADSYGISDAPWFGNLERNFPESGFCAPVDTLLSGTDPLGLYRRETLKRNRDDGNLDTAISEHGRMTKRFSV